MRRVYYTFGVRLATHPVTTHAVVLVLSFFILARLVHVAAVYRNLMQAQVGELGMRLVHMLTEADFATLLALTLIIFTCLSLQWQLRLPMFRYMRTA